MKFIYLFYISLFLFSCRKDKLDSYNFGFIKSFEIGDAQKVIIHNNEIYFFGTSTSGLSSSFVLIKTDLDGKLIFRKVYNSPNNQSGYNMILTSDNNLILIGTTESQTSRDLLIKKVNLFGEENWSIITGGIEDELANDIIELDNGELCIAANTSSYGNGNNDIYLLWISQTGEIIKERTYGGIDSDGSTSILKSNSDLVVLGYTNSWGSGGQDYLLLKVDENGDSIWAKTYGGSEYEESQGIVYTKNNSYIINGHSSSTDAAHNMYAVSVNENGIVNWEKNWGGQLHDGGQTILEKSNGNYLLIGRTRSFGNDSRNIYLVTINANGDIISERNINSESFDWVHHAIEYEGYIYAVGNLSENSNQTDQQIMLAKIKA